MTGQPGDPYQPASSGAFGTPAGPPGPRRKPPWERNALIGVGAVLAVLAAVGFALPGRASSTAASQPAVTVPTPAASAPAAGAAGAASSTPPAAAGDCTTQLEDWFAGGSTRRINGLASRITALGDGMTQLGDDLQNGTSPDAAEAALKSNAAQVQSSAQALQSDPAPACVPGLRSDLSGAAAAYSASAADATNGVNELSRGNLSVSNQDIQAAGTVIQLGNDKAEAAESDINQLDGSQG